MAQNPSNPNSPNSPPNANNQNDVEKLIEAEKRNLDRQERALKLDKERNEATGKRKDLIEKELELQNKILNNEIGGVKNLVKEIADLKKEVNELEEAEKKLKEQQEKLNKAFEDADAAAGALLKTFGFGGSPGLNAAIKNFENNVKDSSSFTEAFAKSFKEIGAAGVAIITSPFSPTRLLESFVGNSIELIGRLDKIRAGFVKLGPQFENLTTLTKQNRQEILAYGGDIEKLSKSFQSLSTSVNYFNFLSEEEQKNLGFLTVGFNNFDADITKVANSLMTGLNMSAEETSQTLLRMKAASDTLGVSVGTLVGSFQASLPVLARFGDSADEVFLKLESISKMTGLSSQDLTGFAKKFDTLEGAASTVQRLNAFLGTTAFSMGEMLELDYAERMQVIRERVTELKGSFQDLDPYMQDSFANLLGMTNLQAAQFFNETADSTDNLTRSTLESVMSAEEFAEKSRESQTAIDKLKSSIQALSAASVPLINGMNTLVDAITVVVLRVTGANEEAQKFDQTTRNLATGIMIFGGVAVIGRAIIGIVRLTRALRGAAAASTVAGGSMGRSLRSMARGFKAFADPTVSGGYAMFAFITAGAAGIFALMAGGAVAMALNATSRALNSFSTTLTKLEDIGAGNVINVLRQITREIESMGSAIEANFQDREAAINFSIATNSLANLAAGAANLNAVSISGVAAVPTAIAAASQSIQAQQAPQTSQQGEASQSIQTPQTNQQGDVRVSVYLDSEDITSRVLQRFERTLIPN
jgi:hypothetical protein